MSYYCHSDVKITSGQTTSPAVDLRGQVLVGIKTPAALTGVTLAFTVSETEAGTYVTAQHLNTLVATDTVITSLAASKCISLPFDKAPANAWVKLVSGSTEAADRTFTLITVPVS